MAVIDMAIVIPSLKIYEKQNPKVRDNAIEKIEVHSTKVNVVKEYNSVVFSDNFDTNELWDKPIGVENGGLQEIDCKTT